MGWRRGQSGERLGEENRKKRRQKRWRSREWRKEEKEPCRRTGKQAEQEVQESRQESQRTGKTGRKVERVGKARKTVSSTSRQEVRAGRAPHDTQHLSSVSRTGAKVEEKKAKGKGEMEKGREQQKKHAGFQFPKSLMSASNSHECRGLGARRRMQNRNQTKDGKCKQRRGEEGRPKG